MKILHLILFATLLFLFCGTDAYLELESIGNNPISFPKPGRSFDLRLDELAGSSVNTELRILS